MKKVFYAIGVLLIVFSIAHYIIMIETMVYYLNDDDMYDIVLQEDAMPLDEMEQIAKECDVTFANRVIKGKGLGKIHVKFSVINPDESIKEGIQPSVFRTGKKEIKYLNKSEEKSFKQIFIITNDEERYNRVVQLVKDKGYIITTNKIKTMDLSFSMLCSFPFLKFFLLIGVLSIIVIVSYYVHRLKEIGILSLNGWTNKQIARKIMNEILKNLMFGFFIPLLFILIYILVTNHRLLKNLILISMAILLFQYIISFISCEIASIVIGKINFVSAIKNRKNNRKFFVFLLVAKIITIALLFVEINSLTLEIKKGLDLNKSYEVYKECDLYEIVQNEPLGENTYKIVKNELNKMSTKEMYNYYYTYEEFVYSSDEIKKIKNINNINNSICCSYNFLEILNVKDVLGRELTNIDITGEGKVGILLVPKHYYKNISKIKKQYGQNYRTLKIIYIEDNQIYFNYTWPGKYNFDPIIEITDIGTSDVLLTKNGKEKFENIMDVNNIADSTFNVRSLVESYEELKSASDMELMRNIIYLIVAIIAYTIVMFSTITIYFELRKKQIGVYMLQGRYPIGQIVLLPIINIIAVTVLAIIMNKYLLSVIIVEVVIYTSLLRRYLKNKAILAIKGE